MDFVIFTNLVGFGAKIEGKNCIAKIVIKNQLMGVRFRWGGGHAQNRQNGRRP